MAVIAAWYYVSWKGRREREREMETVAVAVAEEGVVVVMREYDAERDREGVEAVERMCEVGPSGGAMSLFTDLLGDPLCRVRHSPPFLMLVRTPLSPPPPPS